MSKLTHEIAANLCELNPAYDGDSLELRAARINRMLAFHNRNRAERRGAYLPSPFDGNDVANMAKARKMSGRML